MPRWSSSLRRRAALLAAMLATGAAIAIVTSASAGPTDYDPTFASGGVASSVLATRPVDVARDSQGRVLVASSTSIRRFTAAGVPDATFNGGNALTAGIAISAIAVRSDDSVIVAGSRASGGFTDPTARRITAAGAIDGGFGSGGFGTVTFLEAGIDHFDAAALDVAIAPDGKVVLGGRENGGVDAAFVARLTATGNADATFAGDGLAELRSGSEVDAVTVDGSSRVIGAGRTDAATSSFYVVRRTGTGAPDTTFSDDGAATLATGAAGPARARQIALTDRGAIVAGASAGTSEVAVVRVNASGGVDPTYVPHRETFPQATVVDPAVGMGLRSDGGVVIASTVSAGGQLRAGLIRLRAGGGLDPAFAAAGAKPGTKVLDVPGQTSPALFAAALSTDDSVLLAGSGTNAFVARLGGPNREPQITAFSVPASITAGDSVSVSGAAADPDTDDTVTLGWDFGDGSTAEGSAPSHTYGTGGDFTVTLTARDAAGATVTRSAVVHVTTPASDISASIDVPYGRTLLSDAPFSLQASGSVTPASHGPLTYEWDFGDDADPSTGQPFAWRDGDLDNPAGKAFGRDDTGERVLHTFKRVEGASGFYDPANFDNSGDTKPSPVSEVRKTYVVRVRASDRFGNSRIVGVPVVVRPDRRPQPSFRARRGFVVIGGNDGQQLEYNALTQIWSPTPDPDAERDRIVTEDWDLDGDGKTDVSRSAPDCAPPSSTDTGANLAQQTSAYESCEEAHSLKFNLFALLRRPAGSGDLTKLDTEYPVPSRFPGDPQPDNGSFTFAGAQNRNEVVAAEIAARAAEMSAAGVGHSGERTVRLTQTDRSGRSATVAQTVSVRKRSAPDPVLQIAGATGSGAEQHVIDPIVADSDPNKGDGTRLTIDLSQTAVDRRGSVAFHVLRIGLPRKTPCANPKHAGCSKGAAPDLLGGSLQKTIVTRGNGPVTLSFPHASADGQPWSIQDTVYDETGEVGRARYDGFVVVSGALNCSEVSGQTLGGVSFSGSCVTSNAKRTLYWTPSTVDVNGIKVAPTGGGLVVLSAACGGDALVRGVAKAAAPAKTSSCADYTPSKDARTSLQLVVDGAPVAAIAPSDQPGLTKVRKDDQPGFSVTPTSSARYKGFPFAGDITYKMRPKYVSRIDFAAQFPEVFAADGAKSATGPTTVPGENAAHEVIIRRFDSWVQGSAARVRGRAAIDKNDLPSIDLKGPLTVGGFTLPGVERLRYDPQTGTFEANAKLQLLEREVTAHLILRDGDFELLEGSINANVTIGGAVVLKKIAFKISYAGKKLQLVAGVDFSDLTGAVYGSGQILLEPDPFHLQIRADATVVVIPAHAVLDAYGNGVKFHADAGKSFGPASFHATMDGGFAPNGFFIEGSGETCLFACLTTRGLISHQSVAACGELDLLLTSISAGFGYRFAPGDLDVWLGSCDLSSYKPVLDIGPATAASLRAALPSPNLTAVAKSYEIPVKPSLDALSVVASRVTPDPLGHTPRVRLLYVKPNAAPELVGQTTDLLGDFFRVGPIADGVHLGSPGVIVDQDAAAGTTRFLVPKPKADDGAKYVLQVLDGETGMAPPAYAYTSPPVTKKIFDQVSVGDLTDVQRKGLAQNKVLVFGQVPGTPGLGKNGKLPSTVKASAAAATGVTPKIKTAKQAEVQLTPKPGTAQNPAPTIPNEYQSPTAPSKPQLIAEDATRGDDLTSFERNHLLSLRVSGKLPPGERVQFVDRSSYTERTLGTIIADKKGRFSGTMTFFAAGDQDSTTHCIDANVLNELEQPRGTVEKLKCFTVPGVPKVQEPKEIEAAVDPKLNVLLLDPGAPYMDGDTSWFGVQIQMGDVVQSFTANADLVGGLQAKGASARTARARAAARRNASRPIRKRSWRFRIPLPDVKGAKAVRVRILGAATRKHHTVGRSKVIVLSKKHRHATIRRRR